MSRVTQIFINPGTRVVAKVMRKLGVDVTRPETDSGNFPWLFWRRNIRNADVTIVFATEQADLVADIEQYCRGDSRLAGVQSLRPCLVLRDFGTIEACAADIFEFLTLHNAHSIHYIVLCDKRLFKRISAILHVVTMLTSKRCF